MCILEPRQYIRTARGVFRTTRFRRALSQYMRWPVVAVSSSGAAAHLWFSCDGMPRWRRSARHAAKPKGDRCAGIEKLFFHSQMVIISTPKTVDTGPALISCMSQSPVHNHLMSPDLDLCETAVSRSLRFPRRHHLCVDSTDPFATHS